MFARLREDRQSGGTNPSPFVTIVYCSSKKEGVAASYGGRGIKLLGTTRPDAEAALNEYTTLCIAERR